MTIAILLLLLATTARTLTAPPQTVVPSDTLRLEVGSPEVNGLMFPSHRARNTVYIGDSTTPATS
jgi:hypothetical protein